MAEPLCCSRRRAHLAAAKADLASLARKIAAFDQRNRDTTKLRAKIPGLRENIRFNEEATVEHEAEHAGAAVAV